MSIDLDLEWLKEQAADDKSTEWISKVNEWREYVLKNNRFIQSRELFSVNLGKYHIWFRECGAFSSIEVYQEIFKEKEHFILPEFAGKDARLVVDIGANEGFYTLKMKENNPECKIIAVEPNPYEFEILAKNIKSNHLENVTLVNKAIGPDNVAMSLEVVMEIGAIGSRNIGLVNRPWMKEEFVEKIPVAAITLDALCDEHKISSIDILKIDVEGMEAEILSTAGKLLRNKVRRVVVERHSQELRNATLNLLGSAGFRLVCEEDPLMETYYGDMYFVNEKSIDG